MESILTMKLGFRVQMEWNDNEERAGSKAVARGRPTDSRWRLADILMGGGSGCFRQETVYVKD